MDRRIESKPKKRLLIAGIVTVVVAISIFAYRSLDTSTSFTLDGQRIRTAAVETGVYEDFIPLRAAVEPERTVYLDATPVPKV